MWKQQPSNAYRVYKKWQYSRQLLWAFSAMPVSVGRHEGHPTCKNRVMRCWRGSVWCNVQMICIWSSWCYCHSIISCFIKIQIGLTILVPAYQRSKWYALAGELSQARSKGQRGLVLGEGHRSPPHQLWVRGIAVSSLLGSGAEPGSWF